MDFIRPVMTSAEGRWVARTRWTPAARPIWAMRTMDSSASLPATIIMSAISSMMMTILGMGSRFSCPLAHWL